MQTFKKTSSAATVRAEEKAFTKTRMTGKILAVLVGICCVTSAFAQSYNASKAVAYSEKWTNEINDDGTVRKKGTEIQSSDLRDKPNYRNQDYTYCGTKNSTGIQYGNDCANFVSQCLIDADGGGVDMSAYKASGYKTIVNCVPLHKALLAKFQIDTDDASHYATSTVSNSGPASIPNWLSPGDIVIWWNKGVGLTKGSGTNHAAIVATNDKLLNAHTSNRWHRALSWFRSGSSWSYISYYHISDNNLVQTTVPNYSNERPIIDITIQNTGFTDNKRLIHSGHYNNEEVKITIQNANTIGINNIKLIYKGIAGEPEYSDNDATAYYNGSYLRYMTKTGSNNYNYEEGSGNRLWWYPQTPAAWDGRWVKFIVVNTRGYNNDVTDATFWDSHWIASEPRYVRVVPSNIGVDNLRPWITSINNQTVNQDNIRDVNNVSFSNDISLLIDGRGYVGDNSYDAWEDDINITYVILNGTPNYDYPYDTETPYIGINGTYKFYTSEENHDASVKNKFHLYPQTRSEWEGRYVKIMPWNTQYSIWGKARYIRIIPTLATLTVNQGTLSPTFDPDITNYIVNVANSVTSITIGATANSTATSINSGTGSTGTGTKSLSVGNNIFQITITGNNGASKTYTVTVNRAQPSTGTCKAVPDYDYTLTLGGWTTTSSSIASQGCKIYRFSATAGARYWFKTGCDNGATADFDTQLYLYDSNGIQKTSNDDGCTSNRSIIDGWECPSSGYYYLKVKGYNSAYGNYTLAYGMVNAPTPTNDNCYNATNLTCGSVTTGTVAGATPTTSITYSTGSDRKDVFYYFTTTNAGNYTITLTKYNSADDIDLDVYSSCSATSPVAAGLTGNGVTEQITYSLSASTTYRIRLTDFSSGGSGSFSIRVDCPDSYETNNTQSSAYNFNPSFSSNLATINTTGSNIHVSGDVDYYKITLPAGYKYTVTPRLHDSYSSANGQTYTVDAKFSYSTNGSTYSSTYDTQVSAFTMENGGTLYFKVEAYTAGNTGTYLLAVNITRTVQTSALEGIEALGISIAPNPAEDVLIIKGAAGKSVTFYDIAGKQILEQKIENNKEEITISAWAKGVYLLRIYENGVELGNTKVIKK